MADSIPTFDGEFRGSVTCGQFLTSIEDYAITEQLPEQKMKDLCLAKVSGVALDVFQSNIARVCIKHGFR